MPWIVGGAIVGSAVLGSMASNNASDAASSSNDAAMAAQERISAADREQQKELWDQQQANYRPWMNAGLSGLGKYQNLLNNPNSITNDPGYQFRLQQGQLGVENSASARGMSLSGNTLKGLTEYGQNYATNEYQNALNRYSNLANYGSAAVAGQSAAGTAYGNTVSANLSNLGTNIGQGYQNQGAIGAASAMGPYNSLMGAMNMGVNAYGAGMFSSGTSGAGSMPLSSWGSTGPNAGLYSGSAFTLGG